MIKVAGSEIHMESIIESFPVGSIEREIAKILSDSHRTYGYDSIEQLNFEIHGRGNTVSAARQLNSSDFSFETFTDSRCNKKYWDRTLEGGFLLREDVKPSEAIRDIFINGTKYGNECATAIVIVYYKAVLESFQEDRFNQLFTKIYLMNWTSLDRRLGIMHVDRTIDKVPGDCRYFKNPDVDPSTPEWQGENAIDLGNGLYYGHGIGITNAEGIIRALNRRRKEGPTTSAYLLDEATCLGYKRLYSLIT